MKCLFCHKDFDDCCRRLFEGPPGGKPHTYTGWNQMQLLFKDSVVLSVHCFKLKRGVTINIDKRKISLFLDYTLPRLLNSEMSNEMFLL